MVVLKVAVRGQEAYLSGRGAFDESGHGCYTICGHDGLGKMIRKVAYAIFGGTRGGLDKGVWLLSGSGVWGKIKTCAD